MSWIYYFVFFQSCNFFEQVHASEYGITIQSLAWLKEEEVCLLDQEEYHRYIILIIHLYEYLFLLIKPKGARKC